VAQSGGSNLTNPRYLDGVDAKPSEPSLLDILRRKAAPLVAFVLVCGIVGYVASSLQPSRYKVSTAVQLAPPGSAAPPGLAAPNSLDLIRYTRNEAVIMGGPEVADRADAILKAQGIEAAGQTVVATPSADSDFIDLTVAANSAANAVAASNATVQAYKDLKHADLDAARKPVEARRQSLQAQVVALDAQAAPNEAVLAAARTQYAQATADVAAYDQEIESAQFGVANYLPPTAPSAPSSPKPKQAALFGAIFGLILGAAWVYSSVLRAPRALYAKHAVARVGAPVLSELPSSSGLRPKSSSERETIKREAYSRALSLCLGQLDEGLVVLGVTAPGVDRTSAATLDMAEAAASAGWSVTVIDADPAAHLVASQGDRGGRNPSRHIKVVGAPDLGSARAGSGWFDALLDEADPNGLVLVNLPDLIRQPASVPVARRISGVLAVVNRRTLLADLDEFRDRTQLLDLNILGLLFDGDTQRRRDRRPSGTPGTARLEGPAPSPSRRTRADREPARTPVGGS
jgi:hypothetical protein